MESIVFATNNPHKIAEIQAIIGNKFNIISLSDIGCTGDIPETCPTIEGNASQKARYVSENYGVDCFADDTGLEVETLGGRPGVYSARYAGPACSYDDNVNKLLSELDGLPNRKARFKTVISLIVKGQECLFEGIVNGLIIEQKRGNSGFGYDPVFVPDGFSETFAEMSSEIKNSISHRALAVKKLSDYLGG